MCFAPQRRALFPHRNFQKWCAHVVFCTFSLRNVLRATTACTFSTSELPKVVQTWGVLYILTSKCAARHNDVSFFDISTSKSGPTMVCFVHFWHRNVLRATTTCTFSTSQLPKVAAPGVFCTFWLANALRATAACTFSTFQLPKVAAPGVFCTFWLANALRATAACNFSSLIWPAGSAPVASASLLFDPLGKTECFATFLPFRASASAFFWLFHFSDLLSSTLSLFSLPLPCFAFHLSILSEVWLLNFLRLCICIYIYIFIYLHIYI